MEDGKQPDEIYIDTRMSVVKVLSCKWIMSGYDYIRSSPEISAIEHGVEQVTADSETALESDEDPFDSASDDIDV